MSDYAIQRRRPASITVLGVLHLIGGGLGLLLLLCGAVALLAGVTTMGSPFGGAASGQQGPEVEVTKAMQNIPGYQAVTVAQTVVDLALDVMLLTAGIGLLKLRPWARSLSLVYAVLSILLHIFTLIWSLGFVMPAMEEAILKAMALAPRGAPPGAAAAMRVILIVGLVIGQIFAIYPIVVLFILLSPSVRAAFRGESAAPLPDEPSDSGWRPMRPAGERDNITGLPRKSLPRTLEPPAPDEE